MGLEEFLRLHNATVEDVRQRALSELSLGADDTLFVCGSLVEGLGDQRSDVDLFLITDRKDIRFTSLQDVGLLVGSCLIDVRVLTRAELGATIGRFLDWTEQRRNPRNSKAFSYEERKLLHRIRNGRVLHGDTDFKTIQGLLRGVMVQRHCLDWACHSAGTLQVDLAGLRSASDPFSMVFVAQELLGHTVDALLAAHGFTNPNSKWRCRLLSSLPDRWQASIAGRAARVSARDFYLDLHRAPPAYTLTACANHALRIAAFARRVLPSVESALLAAPTLICGPVDDKGKMPLPQLDLDVSVRFEDGAFRLMRLNSANPAFALSITEYSILALFDGETSREYAEAYASSLWDAEGGADLVEQVLAIVRHGGFEAKQQVDEAALAALLHRS